MIYRAVVEGGPDPHTGECDAINIFYYAHTEAAARIQLQQLSELLLPKYLQHRYEVYNNISEIDLKLQACDEAFADAHLVENGYANGAATYVDDAILFLVGNDRARVEAALVRGMAFNLAKQAVAA